MKTETKKQEKFQKDLEKKSKEIDGVSEYRDILSRVIHEGEDIFKINSKALTLSAVIAGLEIGFSYFLLCTLYYLLSGKVEETTIFKLLSVVYPVGFIMVILGKSALFTEQTSVLTLPVLNGQRTIWELLRIWGFVVLGNVVGGIIFTLFIGFLAPHLSLFTHETMVSIGSHVIHYDAWVLFLSAIVAGWLMGLLNWLLNSTLNSLTRIFLIFMITGVIGFGGFHHSIVGNIEVFGAFLHSETITFLDYLWFLVLALLGNAIGGAIVVGLFKYRIFESNYAS
ncbi:formate/nitrite transporter FocA (FNT family) [Flavobacterium sp. CG_9.1]|uniref:formate/nitrite transporter family protein n=1 Tax=Flavobacterium sp. CG_9.1 TaxID=2787728 RepID=UPI0018CA62BD|nr:formate/nitrite transporter family protein [Flavobacterium sp. CG_9.1]MBG6061117.1 formate/nitrite transporter FocA (FNT family) [Flavobacterium sp. CG_9.1]